jgi:hypothetical protein
VDDSDFGAEAQRNMAEQAAAPKKGWLRTFLGTLGGIFSGACVMYFTAFVDKAVKPARPLPNFRSVPSGLVVQFQNLSQGGDGWWDFGDGSPLEPVAADRQFVRHTYPRGGNYTVKMTLHNVLNEEAERAVSISVAGETASEAPHILALDAAPLSPNSFAPATFRVSSKVSNAQVCVVDVGDEQPLEVVTEPDSMPERLVTYDKPGGYVIKLAAVNGTQYDEKTEVVTVMEPPAGSLSVVLTAAGSADWVDTRNRTSTFGKAFPANATADVCLFELSEQATPGWVFADVRLKATDGREVSLASQTEIDLDPGSLGLRSARSLKLQLSSDRTSVKLTGELFRDPAHPEQPCGLALPATLVEQRRKSVNLKAQQVTGVLPLPADGVAGSAVLPLPPLQKACQKAQRQLKVQLRDGDVVVWEDVGATHSGLVTIRNHRYIAAATLQADRVRIDLLEAPAMPGLGGA